jgi:hypothetical protein
VVHTTTAGNERRRRRRRRRRRSKHYYTMVEWKGRATMEISVWAIGRDATGREEKKNKRRRQTM